MGNEEVANAGGENKNTKNHAVLIGFLSYTIFLACNGVAMILSTLSYPYIRTTTDQDYIFSVYSGIPQWTISICFILPTILITFYIAPVLKAINSHEITRKSQVAALNGPMTISLISVLGWALSFLLYFIGVFISELPFVFRPTAVFFMDVLLTGSICFVFCYYAFEHFSRRFILRRLFPDNVLSTCGAKRNLRTRSRFLMYYMAVGIFPVFIFLRVSTSLIQQNTDGVSIVPMFIIGGVMAVVGLFLTFLIGKSYEQPLVNMKAQVERITSHDFSDPVFVYAKDEMGMLAEGLNRMAGELDEKDSLIKSIRYAKMIQSAILPKWDETKLFFDDSFLIWRPRDIVSGDFFYVRKLGDDLLIGVMDCTGHGVPGAFMTMLVSSGLRRVVLDEKVNNPAEILSRLNSYVKSSLNQEGDAVHCSDNIRTYSDDGLDAAFCLIKPKQNTLIFAGAKSHLSYLESGKLIHIKGDRQSLGYSRSRLDYQFRNHELKLNKGNRYYLYSDGFIDQLGHQKRFPMGRKRFHGLLEETSQLNLGSQKLRLLEAFDEYRGDISVQDDVTIIGFRVR